MITSGSATNFLGCDKGYIKNDYALKIVEWHSHILWHSSTRLSYPKRSVSSLNNPQNSEMKICENMKFTC